MYEYPHAESSDRLQAIGHAMAQGRLGELIAHNGLDISAYRPIPDTPPTLSGVEIRSLTFYAKSHLMAAHCQAVAMGYDTANQAALRAARKLEATGIQQAIYHAILLGIIDTPDPRPAPNMPIANLCHIGLSVHGLANKDIAAIIGAQPAITRYIGKQTIEHLNSIRPDMPLVTTPTQTVIEAIGLGYLSSQPDIFSPPRALLSTHLQTIVDPTRPFAPSTD